ncbi:MAG: hypothetical protein CMF48_01175 [Legionellales bacterium]|nr:hypothetical protein [Legionellales bacterium]
MSLPTPASTASTRAEETAIQPKSSFVVYVYQKAVESKKELVFNGWFASHLLRGKTFTFSRTIKAITSEDAKKILNAEGNLTGLDFTQLPPDHNLTKIEWTVKHAHASPNHHYTNFLGCFTPFRELVSTKEAPIYFTVQSKLPDTHILEYMKELLPAEQAKIFLLPDSSMKITSCMVYPSTFNRKHLTVRNLMHPLLIERCESLADYFPEGALAHALDLPALVSSYSYGAFRYGMGISLGDSTIYALTAPWLKSHLQFDVARSLNRKIGPADKETVLSEAISAGLTELVSLSGNDKTVSKARAFIQSEYIKRNITMSERQMMAAAGPSAFLSDPTTLHPILLSGLKKIFTVLQLQFPDVNFAAYYCQVDFEALTKHLEQGTLPLPPSIKHHALVQNGFNKSLKEPGLTLWIPHSKSEMLKLTGFPTIGPFVDPLEKDATKKFVNAVQQRKLYDASNIALNLVENCLDLVVKQVYDHNDIMADLNPNPLELNPLLVSRLSRLMSLSMAREAVVAPELGIALMTAVLSFKDRLPNVLLQSTVPEHGDLGSVSPRAFIEKFVIAAVKQSLSTFKTCLDHFTSHFSSFLQNPLQVYNCSPDDVRRFEFFAHVLSLYVLACEDSEDLRPYFTLMSRASLGEVALVRDACRSETKMAAFKEIFDALHPAEISMKSCDRNFTPSSTFVTLAAVRSPLQILDHLSPLISNFNRLWLDPELRDFVAISVRNVLTSPTLSLDEAQQIFNRLKAQCILPMVKHCIQKGNVIKFLLNCGILSPSLLSATIRPAQYQLLDEFRTTLDKDLPQLKSMIDSLFELMKVQDKETFQKSLFHSAHARLSELEREHLSMANNTGEVLDFLRSISTIAAHFTKEARETALDLELPKDFFVPVQLEAATEPRPRAPHEAAHSHGAPTNSHTPGFSIARSSARPENTAAAAASTPAMLSETNHPSAMNGGADAPSRRPLLMKRKAAKRKKSSTARWDAEDTEWKPPAGALDRDTGSDSESEYSDDSNQLLAKRAKRRNPRQ